ncbi:L-aspartate oxidase [Bacillus dakarensis]|uniref:L-aspartate oxidase n=1 Tax=Robertmurraya dakarensis TaxID=1926278 RepID=UPI000981E51A|nr:L-aspartate oxidase [Bacillus dakarensis]
MVKRADVVIIGSGVAALQLARKLRKDLKVIILTKSTLHNGNSYMAQGGVAAALSSVDDPKKHYKDTLEAGRYHNNVDAVARMTKEAPALIQGLFLEGCDFDTDEKGELKLGMEGAHSEKRIVHGGGDATGKVIVEFLAGRLHHTDIIEHITVFELMIENNQCIGARGKYRDGRIEDFYAEHVVLATGGLGQLYSFTSSVETVSGDGIALAYRAGAEITDMEFIQFHPTLLFKEGLEAAGLVSEAVRGEGAKLVTEDGRKIMDGVHPLKDLAPRHLVSQTIYDYMKNGQKVYLDITSISNFQQRFPTVTALCREHHVDLSLGKIPVVPGCHFLMGGVKSDHCGRTNINGLYAIGEVACSGIHGANRLASNSLLEGLYIGEKLAAWLNDTPVFSTDDNPLTPQRKLYFVPPLPIPDSHQLSQMMMDCAGIVRSEKGLTKLKKWLEGFQVESWMENDLEQLSTDDIQEVFKLITAWLVTQSALARTESRGGHFRVDFPEENETWLGNQIIHKRKVVKGERDEQIKASSAASAVFS